MYPTLTSNHPVQTASLNQSPSWLKLLDFGNYPHTQGLQKVDKLACQAMCDNFYSLLNRLKRKFGGLPIYIGHPDDSGFRGQPGHTDSKSYGWVKGLRVNAESLWIMVDWSSQGKALVENKSYKFLSPRWEMKVISPRVFSPFKLLSIGLTNQPNIVSDAFCNTRPVGVSTVLSNELYKTSYTPRSFLELVQSHMDATGQDYTSAWSYIKKQKPELYTSTFPTP